MPGRGVTREAHPALAELGKPIPSAQVSVGRGHGLAGLGGGPRSRALGEASVLHQEPAGQGSNRQLENKVNPISIVNTTTGERFNQLVLCQAECGSAPEGSHAPRCHVGQDLQCMASDRSPAERSSFGEMQRKRWGERRKQRERTEQGTRGREGGSSTRTERAPKATSSLL